MSVNKKVYMSLAEIAAIIADVDICQIIISNSNNSYELTWINMNSKKVEKEKRIVPMGIFRKFENLLKVFDFHKTTDNSTIKKYTRD